MMELLDQLFRFDDVENVLSNRACLQGMLDFEAGLARAEARAGVIPSSAAAAIAAKCKAELFDIAEVARGAKLAGNIAIPLVKALTSLVAQADKQAARYIHWGATSQDAIDTGCVLQLRSALSTIAEDVDRLADTFVKLGTKYRSTIVVGRTWMQQALPTTFGAKVAGWLDAVQRHRVRLRETRQRAIVLQFGGAVGTLAALQESGADIAKNLSEELRLPLPEIPWHSHRDRFAEVATTLGLLVGTLGKIAKDISLHSQTEVAEVLESVEKGRGGSSTMPHKRNPVTSAVVLSAAARVPGLVSTLLTAMVQEHERGLGGWQAEWETLPQIVSLSAGALHQMVAMVPKLQIDAERMRENLEATRGLIFAEAVTMALAEKLGKAAAHELVEEACQRAQMDKRHLREVILGDERAKACLSVADVERLFDARAYLGRAEAFVDRVVASSAADIVPGPGGNEGGGLAKV
jgi:3-carboxy-cis,cis-muconate cycloisomerase